MNKSQNKRKKRTDFSIKRTDFSIVEDPNYLKENTLLHLIERNQAMKQNPFQNIKSTHFGGFIKRGSRAILTELQGKGFFKKAINFLEQHEKKLFQQGFFSKYKQELLKEIKEKDSRHLAEINSIQNPVHLDFTKMPSVAAKLVHLGYFPTKTTIQIFEKEFGLKKFTKKELILFLNELNTNQFIDSNKLLKNNSLLVFFKSPKN